VADHSPVLALAVPHGEAAVRALATGLVGAVLFCLFFTVVVWLSPKVERLAPYVRVQPVGAGAPDHEPLLEVLYLTLPLTLG
jgi:hypothetical protein